MEKYKNFNSVRAQYEVLAHNLLAKLNITNNNLPEKMSKEKIEEIIKQYFISEFFCHPDQAERIIKEMWN